MITRSRQAPAIQLRVAVAATFALAACGSKTELTVQDIPADTPPPPDLLCADATAIEPFTVLDGSESIRVRAVAGERVWFGEVSFNAALGWVNRDDLVVTEVRDAEPVINGFVGERRRAYWLTVGLGETTGELRAFVAGETRTLADGFFWPGSLHRVDGDFYFADGTNSGSLRDEMRGRVLRVREGGTGAEVLVEGLNLPTSIAVLGPHVYWADARRGQIGRVRRTGEGAEILVAVDEPRHLVVFDDALYFASDSLLMRLDPATLEVEAFAEPFIDERVNGITADELGLFVTLRDDRARDRLVFVSWDGRPPELVEAPGTGAVTDATRVYWSRVMSGETQIRGVCKARFR